MAPSHRHMHTHSPTHTHSHSYRGKTFVCHVWPQWPRGWIFDTLSISLRAPLSSSEFEQTSTKIKRKITYSISVPASACERTKFRIFGSVIKRNSMPKTLTGCLATKEKIQLNAWTACIKNDTVIFQIFLL